MSDLQTFDRPISLQGEPMPWPLSIIGGCPDKGCNTYAPGEWVTHDSLGGTGMIVAMTEDQMTVLWSVPPRPSGFSSLALPLVRRVFTPNLAKQIVQVQPMTAPVGGVFYMDYTYGGPLEKRCTTGPWWSKLFWRAWRCTSGRTRSWWQSLRFSLRSWSSRKSTSTAPSVPVWRRNLQDPELQKLVEKWSKVLPPPDQGP